MRVMRNVVTPLCAEGGNGMAAVSKTTRFYRRLLDLAILALGILFVNSIWSQIPRPQLESLDSFLLLRCTFGFYMYWLVLGLP